MLILAGIFFVLSFVMANVILRLPLFKCQMIWSVVSVWGITFVVSGVFLHAIWFIPVISLSQIYWHLVVVFWAAWPGMAWLNWKQIRAWREVIREKDRTIAQLRLTNELRQAAKKKPQIRRFVTEIVKE